MNIKDTKMESIIKEIGMNPVLPFGNSSGDISMHETALANKKITQNHSWL